jgi:succinate dehydrogenase / fumarate reductase cytochrome b subunit
MAAAPPLPNSLLWRRLHSLTGLWIVLFLISHLLTNSQAALFMGDDGEGFISSVESIHDLPYLPIIEIFLLALPFAVHIVYGIKRLMMAENNSYSSDGTKPSLNYPRNHAFTWMRITSWLLLVGIGLHVIHMRFVDYPWHTTKDGQQLFFSRLKVDPGLYTLSERLEVDLYDAKRIAQSTAEAPKQSSVPPIAISLTSPKPQAFNEAELKELRTWQAQNEEQRWLEALNKQTLNEYEVIAVSKNFATASLLIVRDTFKSPLMVALYSLLVLAACFHGFNGLWTFLITWGVTLTERSQRLATYLSTFLMIVVAFLGLAAAVGTYWFNLRY